MHTSSSHSHSHPRVNVDVDPRDRQACSIGMPRGHLQRYEISMLRIMRFSRFLSGGLKVNGRWVAPWIAPGPLEDRAVPCRMALGRAVGTTVEAVRGNL